MWPLFPLLPPPTEVALYFAVNHISMQVAHSHMEHSQNPMAAPPPPPVVRSAILAGGFLIVVYESLHPDDLPMHIYLMPWAVNGYIK